MYVSMICVVSGKELMNCKLSGNSLLIRVIAKVRLVFHLVSGCEPETLYILFHCYCAYVLKDTCVINH